VESSIQFKPNVWGYLALATAKSIWV